MTAPAAQNAPTIPIIRPRIIFEVETAFHPWRSDLPTLSSPSLPLDDPFGISCNPRIVHAAKKKLSALIYKAISTELVGINGLIAATAPETNVSSEKSTAATGAVP